MGEVIKFPPQRSCEGCGASVEPDEAALCPVSGCGKLSCKVCLDGSAYCWDHIKSDPRYGRGY